MRKPMLIGILAAIAALGLLFAAIRSVLERPHGPDPAAVMNLNVTIGGDTFALANGEAAKESAPGSAGRNTVRVVGEPVTGDLDGDGNLDEGLLLAYDPGGSGTFFYAVVAMNDGRSYRATNVLPLGDRIAAQTVDFAQSRFVYRFLDRKPGQSMADAPTEERTMSVYFDPASGGITFRDYFEHADWLWKSIGPDPALAPGSATWTGYFADPGAERVAELFGEGTTLLAADSISVATPRYDVTFTEPWGPDPFGAQTVPIPRGTVVPQYEGGDGHLAVQDPVSGQVFGLWQARYDRESDSWTASWGGMTPLDGDGVDTSGSATATNLSRYAGVVGAAEMADAISADCGLNHALVFATDIAGPDLVAPATKSDGVNLSGVPTPIPEGSRIQLDPAVDVDTIPAITPGEKVIAKTLQTHGAYVADQGAARMAFAFEAVPGASHTDPGKAWVDAGFEWDYFDMAHIPWDRLRVLAP